MSRIKKSNWGRAFLDRFGDDWMNDPEGSKEFDECARLVMNGDNYGQACQYLSGKLADAAKERDELRKLFTEGMTFAQLKNLLQVAGQRHFDAVDRTQRKTPEVTVIEVPSIR